MGTYPTQSSVHPTQRPLCNYRRIPAIRAGASNSPPDLSHAETPTPPRRNQLTFEPSQIPAPPMGRIQCRRREPTPLRPAPVSSPAGDANTAARLDRAHTVVPYPYSPRVAGVLRPAPEPHGGSIVPVATDRGPQLRSTPPRLERTWSPKAETRRVSDAGDEILGHVRSRFVGRAGATISARPQLSSQMESGSITSVSRPVRAS